MNTFTKIVLVALLIVAVAHFCPILLLPFGFLGVLVGLAGLVFGFGTTVFIIVGLAVLGAAAVALVSVAAALAPVLIPVLLIVGIVALVRHTSRPA